MGRQIPIVCPGHTRPLAELQFCHVKDDDQTLLVSACHGEWNNQIWIGTCLLCGTSISESPRLLIL
jgi:hypothetical protein